VSKKRLICEGWLEEGCSPDGENIVFPVSTAYVRQDDKVWFATGSAKSLHESIDEGVQVLESYSDLELVERTLPNGQKTFLPENATWTVEGIYQLSDVENANKRKYPRKIWEKLIADPKSSVQKTIKERGMVGHLEHPKDGRTDGKEVALLVTEAALRPDGVVWGKSELLDTPNGLILQEMTRKGVRWGVSSRGNGSVDSDGQVNEDFELTTWDAVMRPSTPGAYPKPIITQSESQTTSDNTSEGVLSTSSAHRHDDAAPQGITETVYDRSVADRLLETSLDALDSTEREVLFRRLVGEQQKVVDHLAVGSLKGSEAQELNKWLNQKLFAIHESKAQSLDSVIEDAIDGINEAFESEPGHIRVIESLREQVSSSVSEIAGLQERLEGAESLVVKLRYDRDEARRIAEQARFEMQEQYSDAEGRLAELAHKLDLANDLLSQQSQDEAVFDAVQDAIRLQPELAEHREVLMCAKDGVTVMRLAEAVLASKKAPVQESLRREEAKTARHTLPQGRVASGKIDTRNLPGLGDLSEGARLAARMLGKSS
jgi:hypothetical protein